MAEAITDISKALEDVGFDAFLSDKILQKAVIRDFEVLGEAATRVPPDVGIVFSTAKSDSPQLRLPLENLRARLDADD